MRVASSVLLLLLSEPDGRASVFAVARPKQLAITVRAVARQQGGESNSAHCWASTLCSSVPFAQATGSVHGGRSVKFE